MDFTNYKLSALVCGPLDNDQNITLAAKITTQKRQSNMFTF